MSEAVAVIFRPSRANEKRPPVEFDIKSIEIGATARVIGASSRGWVFCGTLEGGCGELLAVSGGGYAAVSGFSNDETRIEFDLTHDGVAREVVVTYSTRAD
jgi:hypothetical protein